MTMKASFTWDLPITKYPSGLPLLIEEIDKVMVEYSADGGDNYVWAADILRTEEQSFEQEDLDINDHQFRFTVYDTSGRRSTNPYVHVITADEVDDSGPDSIMDVVLELT